MLPIHAGSTIGDQLCRILQTLHRFSTMSFFMRLLRIHLSGLSNQQLENQFVRVYTVVLSFQGVSDSLDQVYRLLAGRQDLTGLADDTLEMRRRMMEAANRLHTFSHQTAGGGSKKLRLEFGSGFRNPGDRFPGCSRILIRTITTTGLSP